MKEPEIAVPGVSGTTVVITGAAGGIGSATARAFARAGAHVVLTDLDPEPANPPWDFSKTYIPADVTDPDAVADVFAQAQRIHGRVDAVVHAAGVLTTGPVSELTDSDWNRVLTVNATGTMVVTRAAARVLRGPASITVVSSNAGATPRAGMAAYAASKAAATAFVRSLGLELAPLGIRCNVISPGSTDTTMLRGMWDDGDGAAATIAGAPESFRLGIPLGRLAAADDVAGCAVFLASTVAQHITLHDLRVDGGATLDQ
jgi:2,3-dihydro-2,3-dihydroxybenzoate dehydrogenase